MDEDRRDNNNEHVVVERERRSSAGPIIAVVAIIILLLLAFLAFQAADNDTVDNPVDSPDSVDINVDDPTDGQ